MTTGSSVEIPLVKLNNGIEMPQVGFGLGNGLDNDDDMLACVEAALEAGYRSFDTATRYRNERGLGLALAKSGIPRDQLFVTTKVWNTEHGRDSTLAAFDSSLDLLGMEYVDLYLIHFPAPMVGRYVETWLALEELYASGRVRAIGVANFEVHHLSEILKAGSVVPVVNQIELHPRLQQRPLRAVHAEHSIRTEAWSPLARGLILGDPLVASLADRYDATPSQIVLRWHLQIGNVVIPKSVTPSRMRENLDAISLPPLEPGELAQLDSLDCGARTGPHPDEFFDGRPDWNAAKARWNELTQETVG